MKEEISCFAQRSIGTSRRRSCAVSACRARTASVCSTAVISPGSALWRIRLAKLDAGEYDAAVLAVAGLKRLGFAARIREVLPQSLLLPAVGQGALAIETRAAAAAAAGA